LGLLGSAYAGAGRIGEAQKLLVELQEHAQKANMPAISFAVVTAAFAFIGWLNEKCAVRYLEEARDKVSATSEVEES
jgi:hypothetical protein